VHLQLGPKKAAGIKGGTAQRSAGFAFAVHRTCFRNKTIHLHNINI